jgi:hypothetical protein
MLHDTRDLVATQDNGYANRHTGPRHVGDSANLEVQYAAIKEQESAERLVLRGRSAATLPAHDGGFFHGEGPLDDDGIVGTSRSTRKRGNETIADGNGSANPALKFASVLVSVDFAIRRTFMAVACEQALC